MPLKRNIFLMYLILALDNALFWSAIWILYYLRFTNYAGIGVIESVMIITAFSAELPTGAIADLLGKKRAMMIALLLGAIGNVAMGLSNSFQWLLLSVFIMTVGGAFRSGTAEALIYDTLLSLKQENKYERILGNHSTIKMIGIALASIIGGWMYGLHAGLPFLALGSAQLVALFLCLLLVEPPVDTQKFSLSVYLRQTVKGMGELFRSWPIAISSLLVIALTAITLINGQFLIDAQLVAQGWDAKTLGVITALMFFLSAGVSQLTSVLSSRMGKQLANVLMAACIAITMIVIPLLGMMLATVVIMSRNGLLEVFGNTANAIINQNVRSTYRATALSAYNMLASIPYVATAFVIGRLIDNNSVNQVALWLGVILLAIAITGMFLFRPSKGKK